MELSQDEARRLAESLAEVEKHFPMPIKPGKWAAVAMLGLTCTSIYGPRVPYLLGKKQPQSMASAAPAAPVVTSTGETPAGEVDLPMSWFQSATPPTGHAN